VVDEIQEVASASGCHALFFTDSNFLGIGARGRERARAIGAEIIRRQLGVEFSIYARADEVDEATMGLLREAGLNLVYLGIESGAQSALDRWHKHLTVQQNLQAIELCDTLSIGVQAGFLMFDTYTTIEEIVENLSFLRQTGVGDYASFLSQMEVRPGMALETSLRDGGRLRGTYRNPTSEIADSRVRQFQSVLGSAFAPLAPVYMGLREMRHHRQVPRSLVSAAETALRNRCQTLAEEVAKHCMRLERDGGEAGEALVREVSKQAEKYAADLSKACALIANSE